MEVSFDVTHMVDETNKEFIYYSISTPNVQTSFVLDLDSSQTFFECIKDILEHHEEYMQEMNDRRAQTGMLVGASEGEAS